MPIQKTPKISCLNDWRPVALTPIISKCFEKLIRDHICSVLPASLDPLQFTYCSNRFTDDAIVFTLHTALSHLDKRNTYVRMLFVDYSSPFNTIVPSKLVVKLWALALNNSLCSLILDFLTGRWQVVRVGSNISSPLTLNTGAPQGCVLSPLLYSLYTHECVATHSSNVIMKFTDDTTVVGLKKKKKNCLFVTYTIIPSIPSSEICSLHLTHPSAHTLGALSSQGCGAPGSSWGCLAQVSHLSHGQFFLDLRFRPTTLGYKSNALYIRSRLPPCLSDHQL